MNNLNHSLKSNKYLVAAILIAIGYHGMAMFFTLEKTYDALIHLFFSNHYAENWFEHWNFSWYTGFTVTGYPPLVHQSIALLSKIGGLKFGMYTIALTGVILFITGIFRFTKLITNNSKAAGYAAILAVFSTSLVETLHIFGQLPSIIGISILLHALPSIYDWIKNGNRRSLILAFSLIAVTVTSHHVTPIFGMVFFIFPLIGMAIMDACVDKVGSYSEIRLRVFAQTLWSHLRRIIFFGMGSLVLIIGCILPYWVNTKNNPITQIPIPHGSRDNFLEITSSGLVFFLIPWGILLLFLPYLWYRFFSRRLLFFGLSFVLLTILGTGGTTPLPLKMLGENAFNILTLDRFTLWASIMALPIFGEGVCRFVEMDIKQKFQEKIGVWAHRLLGMFFALLFISSSIFTMTLGNFRPSQPEKINTLPIVNFLNQDEHYKWRYLPLGFGDQMAWLSTQTKAMTVDGNYHSARRLPELTSRAVERLENSKFRGLEGIGSLQQFLTVPEKYHLKYIFSNDKFYDPVLHFTGWQRLQRLENGIMVWERSGVPPLPGILSKDNLPVFLTLWWGIVPISTVIVLLLILCYRLWKHQFQTNDSSQIEEPTDHIKSVRPSFKIQGIWLIIMMGIAVYGFYKHYLDVSTHLSPSNVISSYYDAIDFKEFETAYSLLDPESEKSKDQFMLEISVSDGLLSSYAKLDAIDITMLSEEENTATAKVETRWITPLREFELSEITYLKKRKGDWYLIPKQIDLDIPPDQIIATNSTAYYNHGRRRTTAQKTFHQDVLKQPLVEILSSRLVKNENGYSIVGEIQNVDAFPADVSIKSSLYGNDDQKIASFNAKDLMNHTLMPQQTTSFKINFEEVSWISEKRTPPKAYDLHLESNVMTAPIYNQLAIREVKMKQAKLSGTLFNYGVSNATIPQILVSFYDDSKNLIDVRAYYIEESVRSQRKLEFELDLQALNNWESLLNETPAMFVNGLPNAEIKNKLTDNRNWDIKHADLIEIAEQNYSFISVSVNTYIANPL